MKFLLLMSMFLLSATAHAGSSRDGDLLSSIASFFTSAGSTDDSQTGYEVYCVGGFGPGASHVCTNAVHNYVTAHPQPCSTSNLEIYDKLVHITACEAIPVVRAVDRKNARICYDELAEQLGLSRPLSKFCPTGLSLSTSIEEVDCARGEIEDYLAAHQADFSISDATQGCPASGQQSADTNVKQQISQETSPSQGCEVEASAPAAK